MRFYRKKYFYEMHSNITKTFDKIWGLTKDYIQGIQKKRISFIIAHLHREQVTPSGLFHCYFTQGFTEVTKSIYIINT